MGAARCSTTDYDKRTGKAIRGPWTPSLAAARAWRTDALDRLSKGTLSGDGGPSLAQAIGWFLKGMEDGAILNRSRERYKPSVVRGYRRDLRERIGPLLGSARLREVTLMDIQLVADKLTADGLSASSVRNSIMALRALYRWGRPRGMCFHQPCEGVELPRGEPERMRIATPDQAAQLVGALAGHDRVAFALACYAGLRAGELLALDWQHVELELRVIRVVRAWITEARATSRRSLGPPYRVVPITERLHTVLVEHQDLVGCQGLLLPALRGAQTQPMGHSALVKRLAKRWKAAEVESLKLHEGRHTFASLLIAAGANAKAITTYMGHSSIQVTFDRYGHLMPGSEAEVAGLLDTYLGTNASPPASPRAAEDRD